MQLLSLLALAACAGGSLAAEKPLVVLPPLFRWNSTNSITVTPLVIRNRKEVEAEFRIEDASGNLYVREDLIWKAGVANSKHFYLTAPSSVTSGLPNELKLRLILKGGHDRFETIVKASTDLRVVHVFSDKSHYKSGETVTIRALPLDVHNELYTKQIEFVLINPGRFELLRRRAASSNGRFVLAKMPLPQHLQHGEWRVEARSVDSREAAGTVYFNVHDYVLPNFEVALSIDQETTDVKQVPVTVKARYSHTVLVEGSLNLYCFNKSMLVWEAD
ncbi:hypothetical protein PMAYCL1PPCAC_00730, partial [Pristionchus mayeri]